jgi:hypothetical protein
VSSVTDQDARLPIERVGHAYSLAIAVFLGALTIVIGVAMVLMGNSLARAIGVAFVALPLVVLVRILHRR